ncbi:MAG: hypothetical protein AAGJ38_01035 [Planctomycetota bacterium]
MERDRHTVTSARWRRLAADLAEAAQRLDAGDLDAGEALTQPLAFELIIRGWVTRDHSRCRMNFARP